MLGRSLKNAGQAALAVAAAVVERKELTDPLCSDDGAPGQLTLMTDAQCRDLLAKESVGRLAYIAREGTPDIAVVNYSFDGKDLLIRSGRGPKLQAAERGERVVFEVDVLDHVGRRGSSVVVHGTARRLPAELDSGPTPWARGPRQHLIRIQPSRLSGRTVS